MNQIDDVSIDKLVEEYGSPIFVVSEKTLRDNVRAFRKSFSDKYPQIKIAYSYKTNCLPGVLRIIHSEGAWADAASGFEYEIARKIGAPGKSIVFNGPCKKKKELEKAVMEGALINVDHPDELRLLEDIAITIGRALDIGIRVNMDVGIHQATARFGFNLESGEAMKIANRCAGKKLLNIIALHIHLVSYIIESECTEQGTPASRIKLIWPKTENAYRVATTKVIEFAKQIEKRLGVRIKYVDMGGGFPNVQSLNPYVDAIVNPLLDGFKGDLPILILEPGRAIVRDAVHLITTVAGVKELQDGGRAVIIDAGINLLPTSLWKWQEIEPVNAVEGNLREATVYGPLCLQTDIIGKAILSEKIKLGDKLVIKNVGAYNISQSSSFIFPRPPVVSINKGTVKILRRSETVDDEFSLEGF